MLIGISVKLEAQEKPENASAVIARIYEQLTSDGESELDLTTLEDDLNYFAQHPINLNNTTKEELEKLQFLTDKQIENLLYYLYRQKPMHSIYELQLVDGFNSFLIRNLLPFVYVGGMQVGKEYFPKIADLIKYGKNELFLRVDRSLERKSGYIDVADNQEAEANGKRYVGDPNYISVKYVYRFRDKVEFGIVGEKDPGEQFWGSCHKGFDFYSAYFQLANFGKLKSLVAGNFRANFGMGLVIHPELSMGKSSDIMNVIPRNSGLKKSSSTDEYNYLRGLGATVKFGKVEVSSFCSYKFIDGDSTGTAFSYIKTDGLHRTLSDLERKNTISMQIAGGNVSVRFSNLHAGLTVVDTRLSRKLEPELRPDNLFAFRGNHQLAAGFNYRWKWKGFTLFGEEATQSGGGFATLNGFTVSPVSTVNLVALYRNYSRRYDVLLANAFAEGSKVNNEEGFYVGLETFAVKHWKLSAYVDVFSFPWLKYSVSKPSAGYDLSFTANFVPSKKTEMYWRIRYEQKEMNLSMSTVTDYTGRYDKASLRYWLTVELTPQLNIKSMVEVNRASSEESKPTFGSLLSQELTYSFGKIPLMLDCRYEFFDATDYDNRIYSYEKDILYVFSSPMLYGKGCRWYLNCKWEVNRKCSLWLKVAETVYADQSVIGTGLEAILANHKTDVRAMVRVKF